jgi:hypothetical protein
MQRSTRASSSTSRLSNRRFWPPLRWSKAIDVRSVGARASGLTKTQGVCLQGPPRPCPCAIPLDRAPKGCVCLLRHQLLLVQSALAPSRRPLRVDLRQNKPVDLATLWTHEGVEVESFLASLDLRHRSFTFGSPHPPDHRLEAQSRISSWAHRALPVRRAGFLQRFAV